MLTGKSPRLRFLPAGRSDHWLGRRTSPVACTPGRTRAGALAGATGPLSRVRAARQPQVSVSRATATQSYGLLTVRGGTDKAARLPKGWTGPVSMLGLPGIRKDARIFLRAPARTKKFPEAGKSQGG